MKLPSQQCPWAIPQLKVLKNYMFHISCYLKVCVVKFITLGSVSAVAPAVHKPVRHYKLAPAPSDSSPEPPFDKGHSSPASSPSTYKNHHARNKVTSPALTPSYLVSPSTSKQPGLMFHLNYMRLNHIDKNTILWLVMFFFITKLSFQYFIQVQ